MKRMLGILVGVGLAGCATVTPASTSSPAATAATTATPSVAPTDVITMVTCGGAEAFAVDVLDGVGPPPGNDAAADVLRRHIELRGRPTDLGSFEDWIEAVRIDRSFVLYILPEAQPYDAALGEVPWYPYLRLAKRDARWTSNWGGCEPQPAVERGVIAEFRLAPGVQLTEDSREVDVLVTETTCNSGEDARGRVLPPEVFIGVETVTIVMAIRPRDGAHTCPSNPPTPFVLQLPEPLGGRRLLDGSSIPPRDPATGVVVPDG